MMGLDGLDRGHTATQEFEDLLLSYGTVEVVLPSRKHGTVGTYPRRSSEQTTCCPQKPMIIDRQK